MIFFSLVGKYSRLRGFGEIQIPRYHENKERLVRHVFLPGFFNYSRNFTDKVWNNAPVNQNSILKVAKS